MAVDVVTGPYTTTDTATNERVGSYGDRLLYKFPNWSPLTVLMMKMRKGGRLTDPSHRQFVVEDLPYNSTLSAGINNSTTTVPVATGTGVYFSAGDIVNIPSTGENMLVSSISTDDLTVVRAFGTASAASASSGAVIIIVSHSNEENADTPQARAPKIAADENFSQIIRVPVKGSRTLTQTKTRPPADGKIGQVMVRNRLLALRSYQAQMERSIMFGQKKEYTAGTEIRRSMGGIKELIEIATAGATGGTAGRNLVSLGGIPFDPGLIDMMASMVQNVGSANLENKILVMGPAVRQRANQIATKAAIIKQDPERTKKYGIRIESWVTTFGELPFITSHHLAGSGGPNVTTGSTAWDGYGGTMFIADLSQLELMAMQPLVYLQNRQNPGVDGQVDEWLWEGTVSRANPEAHVWVSGING